jgi:hypothetical protein
MSAQLATAVLLSSTTSERIGHQTRMLGSLDGCSGPEASNRALFSADLITII